jgi:hypothetical protein
MNLLAAQRPSNFSSWATVSFWIITQPLQLQVQSNRKSCRQSVSQSVSLLLAALFIRRCRNCALTCLSVCPWPSADLAEGSETCMEIGHRRNITRGGLVRANLYYLITPPPPPQKKYSWPCASREGIHGEWGMTHLIANLGIRLRRLVSFTLQPRFFSMARQPYMGLGLLVSSRLHDHTH